jgi:hypothetical protein
LRYEKIGHIKPVEYGRSSAGPNTPLYHPDQFEDLKARLGITLKSNKGLISGNQIRVKLKISATLWYSRIKKLITPKGIWFSSGGGTTELYHPNQIAELKKKLKKSN